MLKNYLSLAFSLILFGITFGQVKIAEVNFEVPGGYTTSITEFTDIVPSTGFDYFLRTNGSDIGTSVNFNNIQGNYYFAAQDIDGEGATPPFTLDIDDIDISGFENLEFRVYLAEDDANDGNEDWDSNEYIHFNYDMDNSGTYTNLLWLESDQATGFNRPLFEDTDFNNVGDGTEITDTFTQFTKSIALTGSLLDIEIVFNMNAGDEDIAIDNIEIWGTYSACSTTTTWTNTGWDNGAPDINTSVILDFDYNTTAFGNITACDLTINAGNTLRITDNSFVNVKNEITTDGDIILESQGAIVQKNDASVNATTGTITVQKETSILNGSLDYTYWSSPVTGETIENAFAIVPNNRRYYFVANNFIDILEEVDNTGVYNPGQDDIDDDANAWQLASGVMTPGVGYAATPSPFGPFPAAQQFTFVGPLNNGVYQPAIVNNSGGAYNDWNFIGNPYPSAIDTNKFFSTNAGIVDNIYLWSQATPLNANAQGNEGFNFSGADYAVISASGVNTAGGSGVIPNDYIPSGQGFFVEALGGTNVTFNNSMRDIGNNTQFFRTTNPSSTSSNRDVIWVNLTSDNGVFNQIAVAHLIGATDGNDGTFYDVKRNASSQSYARLYSTIENSEDEFVIQGKNYNSLDINEIIDLGFNTSIDSPTLFTISIAQFEGEFYADNNIYLIDNLLSNIHNLKESDYTFTSEIGEFNDRFKIVFSADALSLNENIIDENALLITELSNGNVRFSVNSNHFITNVQIIDLVGRTVYNLKGEDSSETYNLDNLDKSVYIARVTLSNGQTISKKAIKRL
ncbi:T9SS type A sorting domain-containing protein [Winogradskyella sp. A2]|uniref:T9SS type A sorting domain-containing protein n=1 Tax=Winogradskyella sp. A2 TaxID=3366944 RepID=UPI00398C313B